MAANMPGFSVSKSCHLPRSPTAPGYGQRARIAPHHLGDGADKLNVVFTDKIRDMLFDAPARERAYRGIR
jgi:hypothetical protein